jgi:hypothetical protein
VGVILPGQGEQADSFSTNQSQIHFCSGTLAWRKEDVARGKERMRTSKEPLPLVVSCCPWIIKFSSSFFFLPLCAIHNPYTMVKKGILPFYSCHTIRGINTNLVALPNQKKKKSKRHLLMSSFCEKKRPM